MFNLESFKWGGYVTPWVEEIVKKLKLLECVRFRRMIVRDNDLEVLAERCGEKLKVLKLDRCSGFSTDGLLHTGKKCSGLRTLSLDTRGCPRKYVVEAFSYAVTLEEFGGDPYIDEGEEYIGVEFLSKMRRVTRMIVRDNDLEVLAERCGEKLKVMLHHGLTDLAKGCLELECLHVNVKDITNETLGCIGANLKKLSDFYLGLFHKVEEVSELPLDKGVRALLTSCTKLVKLGLLELSKGCPKLQKFEMSGCDFSQQALADFVLKVTSLRYLWVQDYHAFKSGHDIFAMVRPFWKMELIKYKLNVVAQQKPSSLLAYYSVSEQRKDIPDNVIPLYPYVQFE
ncbi:coronatine-insensitive protein 1-like protein [Tanacetum coccineum]